MTHSSNARPESARLTNGPLIELRQVVKTYATASGSFTALKQVDLQVSAGEYIAVVGRSGSGKSTLLNMLTGIDRPTEGEIYIDGAAIHGFKEGQMASWRGRTIGVVFQFFQLLPTLTIVENVLLPMDLRNLWTPRQRRERALQLLEQVGVAEQADKLPSALSGGQQQRAAIARALANDPPILVADEPTGNLDSTTTEDIFRLFASWAAAGKTVLIVTHERDIARRVDRTIMLADGAIVHDGPTA